MIFICRSILKVAGGTPATAGRCGWRPANRKKAKQNSFQTTSKRYYFLLSISFPKTTKCWLSI